MVDEILEGKEKPQELLKEFRDGIHEFVLDNAMHLQAYKEKVLPPPLCDV